MGWCCPQQPRMGTRLCRLLRRRSPRSNAHQRWWLRQIRRRHHRLLRPRKHGSIALQSVSQLPDPASSATEGSKTALRSLHRGCHDPCLNQSRVIILIAYWSAAFTAIVITEHVVFRKQNCDTYDHAIWNSRKDLPTGIAALGAAILSFGLVIPCMSQVWYTGPLAETTGDIGFEVALVLSAILYVPMRMLEIKIRGRL